MGRIRKIIPSMFHRRLALMACLMVAPFVLLSGRLGWVTLVNGADAREQAERRLLREQWLPTVRGRILDRQGRVLAQDRPSYDIVVDYAVLTGDWARTGARRFARAAHRDVWGTLDAAARDELIARYLPAYERRVDQMWDLVAEGAEVDRAVVEQARVEVIERVERMQAAVTARRAESERAKLVATGLTVGEAEEARIRSIAEAPIAEKLQAHPVVRGVSDKVGFRFMRLTERQAPMFAAGVVGEAAFDEWQPMLPGLKVEDTTERVYPFDMMRVEIDRSTLPATLKGDGAMQVVVEQTAALMLGSVRRRVFEEDVQRRRERIATDAELRERALTPDGRDTGAYEPTSDRVGHTGVEAAMEDRLRGTRGLRIENLQTRAVQERAPTPGLDVRLTLDIQLQARVRAILDPAVGLTRVQEWHHNEYLPVGTELDAAAVVLDVGTGEILAMVSMPEAPRDGDWSRRGLSGERLEQYLAVHTPYVNRAVGKPYQPGSIVKALILCGAVRAGVYAPGERIKATGHYFPNQPNAFRSWIFKQNPGITHADQLGHDPDEVDALTVSSNVFFFTLGDRLGASGVADVYRSFGVGRGFDLGLGAEWPGSIGALSNGVNDGSDLTRQDAIFLGIGQGPITWTPLHAADAYATIARGGARIVPRLISEEGRAPKVEDLRIPSRAVRSTLDGLLRASNDPRFGTGYDFAVGDHRERVFNAAGVRVWGKTGTADSSPIMWDPDGDGPAERVVVRDGDHSWYVILVGEAGGAPKYAVSVVVDYGGSGGRVSGPIANQVVHALIQEGYLSGATPQAVSARDGGGR